MPNRLILEKSPYLLQHAHNPVDWYAWGPEAFHKAKSDDKPIFLSIGYSTCYWCHVMEREVFENTSIAQLMNDSLICVKVDREEQPDVDRIYMSAVQAMTGSGGWPMSVFLTHDLKPFFGGTYFPPAPRHGRPGFPQLVERISHLWKTERDQILKSGDSIYDYLNSNNPRQSPDELSSNVLATYFDIMQGMFDPSNGGFGHAPKFPRPATLTALLRYYAASHHKQSLAIVLHTLKKMAHGGIYDHLGGGFHRYSVDEQWRVPHFEKMLYDQAQLVCLYLEAYQITADIEYATIAKHVLSYLDQRMTHKHGGFYSAEDAESAFSHDKLQEKEEGTCYLWSHAEIQLHLGNDAALFCFHYGVLEHGNAPADPMGVFQEKNILYEAHTIEETAAYGNLPIHIALERIEKAKIKLLLIRNLRPQPSLDDKIITAWNGLAISAYSKAYQLFQDEAYLTSARSSAQFIIDHLFDSETNILYRRWRDGEARFPGTLQDYAFFIQGLLDLYESSFETRWLDFAVTLQSAQIELFSDGDAGGFFDSPVGDPTHIVRMKEQYDSAEPTGNSVSALNFFRLSHLTHNPHWKQLGQRTIQSFGALLHQRPDMLPFMLAALDWDVEQPKEIIITGENNSPLPSLMLAEIHQRFIPRKILIRIRDDKDQQYFSKYLPFVRSLPPPEEEALFYLCENFSCQLPISDITAIKHLLDTISKV